MQTQVHTKNSLPELYSSALYSSKWVKINPCPCRPRLVDVCFRVPQLSYSQTDTDKQTDRQNEWSHYSVAINNKQHEERCELLVSVVAKSNGDLFVLLLSLSYEFWAAESHQLRRRHTRRQRITCITTSSSSSSAAAASRLTFQAISRLARICQRRFKLVSQKEVSANVMFYIIMYTGKFGLLLSYASCKHCCWQTLILNKIFLSFDRTQVELWRHLILYYHLTASCNYKYLHSICGIFNIVVLELVCVFA